MRPLHCYDVIDRDAIYEIEDRIGEVRNPAFPSSQTLLIVTIENSPKRVDVVQDVPLQASRSFGIPEACRYAPALYFLPLFPE
jgi:hypothetical protein